MGNCIGRRTYNNELLPTIEIIDNANTIVNSKILREMIVSLSDQVKGELRNTFNDSCIICYDDDNSISLSCRHKICTTCFWKLTNKTQCPMCASPMKNLNRNKRDFAILTMRDRNKITGIYESIVISLLPSKMNETDIYKRGTQIVFNRNGGATSIDEPFAEHIDNLINNNFNVVFNKLDITPEYMHYVMKINRKTLNSILSS